MTIKTKSPIINGKELRFVALRRSGHHAVINWIISNIEHPYFFLNNCERNTNPFCTCLVGNSVIPTDLEKERRGEFSKKNFLIYNYEDKQLTNVFSKKFHNKREMWVGKSKIIFNVLVLRDPYNHFASKLRWAYGTKHTPTLEEITLFPKLWKTYAYEFLDKTHFLDNKLLVNFNDWFLKPAYRKELAQKMELLSFENGVEMVAKYGPQVWGDSFDGLKFDNRAQEMPVLERWINYKEDEFYKGLFKDKELINLAKEIFGEIPGTEVLVS